MRVENSSPERSPYVRSTRPVPARRGACHGFDDDRRRIGRAPAQNVVQPIVEYMPVVSGFPERDFRPCGNFIAPFKSGQLENPVDQGAMSPAGSVSPERQQASGADRPDAVLRRETNGANAARNVSARSLSDGIVEERTQAGIRGRDASHVAVAAAVADILHEGAPRPSADINVHAAWMESLSVQFFYERHRLLLTSAAMDRATGGGTALAT